MDFSHKCAILDPQSDTTKKGTDVTIAFQGAGNCKNKYSGLFKKWAQNYFFFQID